MKNNAKQRNPDKEKKQLWKEIELIYRKSVNSIWSILKNKKVYHFYEDKDGWDDNPQPITGCVREEMTPEEIIVWMYENDVNPRNTKSPDIYTDYEISSFKENRNMMKIEDCKRSIEFYKEQIKKNEGRIKDLQRENTMKELEKDAKRFGVKI